MAKNRGKRPNAGNKLEEVLQALRSDEDDPLAGLDSPGMLEGAVGGAGLTPGIRWSEEARGKAGTLVTDNPNEDIGDLEASVHDLEVELKTLQLRRRRNELQEKITRERVDIPPAPETAGTSSEAPTRGKKAKNIVDYLWTNPLDILEEGSVIDIGGGAKVHIAGPRKTALGKISIEQWTYASLQIMMELDRKEYDGYIKYMQVVMRLTSNNLWSSVLLYDREYRDRQCKDNFPWGAPCVEVRNFYLIPKANSATSSAMREMGQPAAHPTTSNLQGTGGKRKGPFMPDGKEICRRFNADGCNLAERCKLAHGCALCYSYTHGATRHRTGPPQEQGRPLYAPTKNGPTQGQ